VLAEINVLLSRKYWDNVLLRNSEPENRGASKTSLTLLLAMETSFDSPEAVPTKKTTDYEQPGVEVRKGNHRAIERVSTHGRTVNRP
jgi:hypothetical protein